MIVLVIPFFLMELYLSLKVGESIGFLGSVVWIVASFLLGMALLKRSSYTMLGNIYAMQRGRLDIRKFQNASLAYVAGAVLLIVPGVFSDLLGVFALLYTLYLQFIAKITPESHTYDHNLQGEEHVIDVEIIDEHTHSDRNA